MLKKIQNDKGLTLVELLAALVIVSIIGALSYSVLFQGYSNYQRIQAETQLRDEADLIMSSFIKDMFVLKANEIMLETTCTQNNSSSIMKIKKVNSLNPSEVIEEYQTGFKNGEVIVKDQTVHLYNSSVKLVPNNCGNANNYSITEEKTNSEYKIKFTLEIMKGKTPYKLEFENRVQVINFEGGE